MEVVSYDEKLLPKKGSIDATCYDIRASKEITIEPGEIKLIPTGIKMNYGGKVYARSSLPYKRGLLLANSVGIIDNDYRGELFIQVYNIKKEEVVIEKYERIAQMEFNIEAIYMLNDKNVYNNWEVLNKTQRGDGGFGSTGKN